MKSFALSALLFSVVLVGCDNPADHVPAAEVGTTEAVPVSNEAGTIYTLSEASSIGFTGSKVTGSHDGGFKKISGEFAVTEDGLAGASHRIVIDMTSTWADHEKLQGHLRSADFFDVAQYPESIFEITGLKKEADGQYTVSGNFTLHGVTKRLAFPATVAGDSDRVKIKAEFSINRHDFGISYPGKKDDLIREEVVIRLDLEALSGK